MSNPGDKFQLEQPEIRVAPLEPIIVNTLYDHEVMTLAEGGKNKSFEIFLALSGASLALVLNLATIVGRCASGGNATPIDMITFVLFGLTLGGAIVSGYQAKAIHRVTDELLSAIRLRSSKARQPQRQMPKVVASNGTGENSPPQPVSVASVAPRGKRTTT